MVGKGLNCAVQPWPSVVHSAVCSVFCGFNFAVSVRTWLYLRQTQAMGFNLAPCLEYTWPAYKRATIRRLTELSQSSQQVSLTHITLGSSGLATVSLSHNIAKSIMQD